MVIAHIGLKIPCAVIYWVITENHSDRLRHVQDIAAMRVLPRILKVASKATSKSPISEKFDEKAYQEDC